MASIYGFTLKRLVRFQGREWEGIQGNIYYNGKRVGWYSDDGNGSCCADIEFFGVREARAEVENALTACAERYIAEHPDCNAPFYTTKEEFFIEEIIRLINDEKAYKKGAKDGYKFMFAFHDIQNDELAYIGYTTEEGMNKGLEKRKGHKIYGVYKSLQDFIIE